MASVRQRFTQILPLSGGSPNIVADTVRIAILGNRNISNDLRDNFSNGLSAKARSMQGAAINNYVYGLPNLNISYDRANDAMIQAAIEAEIGKTISITAVEVGPININFIASDHLIQNRGYNFDTGEVKNPPVGTPNGRTIFQGAEIITNGSYEITYDTDTGSGPGVDGTVLTKEVVNDVRAIRDKVYYHVQYIETQGQAHLNLLAQFGVAHRGPIGFPVLQDSTDLKMWIYEPATDVHPELALKGNEEERAFLPVIPIREGAKDLTNPAERDELLYRQSTTLLSIIGLGIDNLGDAVHGRDPDNEAFDPVNDPYWVNPAVAEVDNAYFYCAVDVHSDEEVVIEYLHEFHKYLRRNSQHTLQEFNDVYDRQHTSTTSPYLNTLDISDSNFRQKLQWGYVTIENLVGIIEDDAEVGDVTKEIVESGRVVKWQEPYGQVTDVHLAYFITRKQITTEAYEEVTVCGYRHYNYVIKSENDYNLTYITDDYQRLEDEKGRSNFLIPVHIPISFEMGANKQNQLVHFGMVMVISTLQIIQLEWYQEGWFKVVITIVSLVLTAMSGIPLFQALSPALGAAGALLVTAAIQVGTTYVVKSIAEHYGPVAAFIAGVVISMGRNVLQRSLSVVDGVAIGFTQAASDIMDGLLDIVPLLQNVAGLTEAVIQQEVKSTLEEIQAQLDLIKEEEEELTNKLDKLTENALDPNVISSVRLAMDPNMSVETWMDSKVHKTNMADFSMIMVEGFVETSLMLEGPRSDINLTNY